MVAFGLWLTFELLKRKIINTRKEMHAVRLCTKLSKISNHQAEPVYRD